MSTLLTYSGLTTKIRAMESHLIREDGYRQISEMSSVAELISYLRGIPGYREIFDSVDENALHRGEIERRINASIYWGFMRIYRFAGPEQKPFLDLYFQRYELFLLKRCFRKLADHQTYEPKLGRFDAFFRKHSCLDLESLSAARNREELVQALKGTEYYDALAMVADNNRSTIFDWEMALDRQYFIKIWKKKDRLFSGYDLECITRDYGTKFDLVNLDWIYRAKQFYHLSEAETYAMLLPVHYRLTREQITAMVEADSMEAFGAVLGRTYYADRHEELTPGTLEDLYSSIMKQTLRSATRKNPYSVAVIYSYLYQKEHEVDRLTTALECIRYHLDPAATYQYISKN